ncbi:MAG: hypothetical protein ABIH34_01360 [Nanoarchaeota archaeon]
MKYSDREMRSILEEYRRSYEIYMNLDAQHASVDMIRRTEDKVEGRPLITGVDSIPPGRVKKVYPWRDFYAVKVLFFKILTGEREVHPQGERAYLSSKMDSAEHLYLLQISKSAPTQDPIIQSGLNRIKKIRDSGHVPHIPTSQEFINELFADEVVSSRWEEILENEGTPFDGSVDFYRTHIQRPKTPRPRYSEGYASPGHSSLIRPVSSSTAFKKRS